MAESYHPCTAGGERGSSSRSSQPGCARHRPRTSAGHPINALEDGAARRTERRSGARTGTERSVGEARTERQAQGAADPVTDVEEIRRRAREAWLQLRAQEVGNAAAPFLESVHEKGRATPDHDTLQSEPQPRDDFAL